ncbi:DUF5696 domain-containing protein [Enterococcus sp. AZ173]|uniref:DUF5696 domain-containing protein n=1 Tax=Enterococcus sp. AZ173 TaxID=2774700 RepID=UPI003D2CBD39
MNKKWLTYILFLPMIVLLGFWLFDSQEVRPTIEPLMNDFQAVTVNTAANVSEGRYEAPSEIPDTFRLAAENEQLVLYVEEETAAILVFDKVNGEQWASYDYQADYVEMQYSQEIINYIKSGVSIVTYDRATPGRRTLMDSGVTREYQFHEDGFVVAIDFTSQKIRFEMRVTIQGGDLLVHIPKESIEEYNENLWQPGNNNISLNQLIMYPFFASTEGEETGYLVIPDGPGATIRLDETPRSLVGYSAPVYGLDQGYEDNPRGGAYPSKPIELLTLPLYGVIKEENSAGVLVISENGESYATYNYRPKNTDTHFYQSYFTYTYRTAYSQFQSRINEDQHILGFQELPNEYDVVQRYVFLREDEANYVGLAKSYRSFIEQLGKTKEKETPEQSLPLKIDFLMNEVKMGNLGIEEITLTDPLQAKAITEQLLENGIEQLTVTAKAFLQDRWTYGIGPQKNLNNDDDFQALLAYFHEHEVDFNFYVDYTKTYHNASNQQTYKLNRNDFQFFDPEKATLNYMNSPYFYASSLENDLTTLADLAGVSLALAGFDHNVFTFFEERQIHSSLVTMTSVKQLLERLEAAEIATNIYQPNAYLFPYLDEYYDTPIYSSGFVFIDETIPLLQLILSGQVEMYSTYLNSVSHDQDTLLRLIEFGVYPTFVLTGEPAYKMKNTGASAITVSEYEYLSERIMFYYEAMDEALSVVRGSEMVDHQLLADGVVQVTYANQKTLTINYNETTFETGEVIVEGKGVVVR